MYSGMKICLFRSRIKVAALESGGHGQAKVKCVQQGEGGK